LRGVLCQALLPSLEGDRYHLATECLTSNPEVVRMIESNGIAGIRALMDGEAAKANPGCFSMNSALNLLLHEKKISVDDARNATTDRIGFMDIKRK
jgi:twitching motility protein PilT